jgi:nickel transport protein
MMNYVFFMPLIYVVVPIPEPFPCHAPSLPLLLLTFLAYGTQNLPKGEAGAVIDSWLSVESVKRPDEWGPALARPLTPELEIVPQGDPLPLKTGDKLRLMVTLNGRPAASVTVAYFGHPRGVSGPDGQVNVRLQQPGFQLIQASLESPLADGKADKLIQSTALQFEIAP